MVNGSREVEYVYAQLLEISYSKCLTPMVSGRQRVH